MELKNENFHEEIKNGVTLVDFYATWCGPCKMMHPIIEKIEKKYPKVKVIKVDVDLHEELSREYGIMSIPTLCFTKNGEIVEKNIGFTSENQLEKWIEKYQSEEL